MANSEKSIVDLNFECFKFVTKNVIVNNEKIQNSVILTDMDDESDKKIENVKIEISEDSINMFKEILLKVQQTNAVNEESIESFLKKKRETLQEKLKNAYDFFNVHKNYKKASEFYKTCLYMIENDDYPDEYLLSHIDILTIKYAFCLSKVMQRNSQEASEVLLILLDCISNHDIKFPSLHYCLARCYYILSNYKSCKAVLEEGLNYLKNKEILTEMTWPGTATKLFTKSDVPVLEEDMKTLLNQLQGYQKPDALCSFNECEKQFIYFNNICFNGYTCVQCSQKCYFKFHRDCWKKKLKIDGTKKFSKIINQFCTTDKCSGVIVKINIYDENMQVTSTFSQKTEDTTEKKCAKNENKESNETTKKVLRSKPVERHVVKKLKNPPNVSTQLKITDDKLQDKKNECNNVRNEEINTRKLDTLLEEKIDIKSKLTGNTEEFISASIKSPTKSMKLNFYASEYIPKKPVIEELSLIKQKNFFLNPTVDKIIPPVSLAIENKQIVNIQSTHKIADMESISSEVEFLRKEMKLRNEELFQTEEAYNVLLKQYKMLEKTLIEQSKNLKCQNITDQCLQTDEINVCSNCPEKENLVLQKIEKISTLERQLKNEATKNENSAQQITELAKLLHKEREHYVNHIKNLKYENDALIHKISEMEDEKLKKNINDNNSKRLQQFLLQQIDCIKNSYVSYYIEFENKCKYMIWELNELICLSSNTTAPTKSEVEENKILWMKSLQDAENDRQITLNYYSQLKELFDGEQSCEQISIIALPQLITEPPNITMRHFKAMIIINKKLEDDLSKHMHSFYRMISTPYPGAFPQFTIHQGGNFNTLMESKNLEIYMPKEIKSVAQTVDLSNFSSVNHEVANTEETISTASSTSISVVNNSTIKRTQISESNLKLTPVEINHSASQSCNKQVEVVGQESLIMKLQTKFPLVPPRVLSQAVQIMRDRHGGLTGKDAREIFQEVKIVLKEMQEKMQQKLSSENSTGKLTTAWKQVSSGINWQNDNSEVNCTICFELLKSKNSLKLRCRHIFHAKCIKRWLQSNSICPICRSFTTLDEEFPPLK